MVAKKGGKSNELQPPNMREWSCKLFPFLRKKAQSNHSPQGYFPLYKVVLK